MGLLGLFKKKPRKNFATLEEVKGRPEDVEVSDKPIPRNEIQEIGGDAREVESVAEESSAETSEMSMFDTESESGEMGETASESEIKLEDAMILARKYLIVHAQIPNDLLPKKSTKRENGTFYFEFQDRELNRIELDGKGEVTDWEREKL